MTLPLASYPFYWALDAAGAPYNGAKLYIYQAGSSLLATIYSDPDGTTATNPLVSDSAGRFQAYWLALGSYDLKLFAPGTSPPGDSPVRTVLEVAVAGFDTLEAIAVALAGAGTITPNNTASADRFFLLQASTGDVLAITRNDLQALGRGPGYIYGLTLSNNGSDATNDIDFASGQAIDSTGLSLITCAALTKRLDATWAAGNNQGGLDTGSIANGTYHSFAIKKDSDGSGDFLFSASPTSPTMPAGYTAFRRIGSILRESAALVGFVQIGDKFLRKAPSAYSSSSDPGTSAVLASLGVPTGIQVDALITGVLTDITPASITRGWISSPDQTDAAAGGGNSNIATDALGATPSVVRAPMNIRTDTSGRVRFRLEASNSDISVSVLVDGWVDTRGRFS